MKVNYHRWGNQQRRGYWERWTCVSSVSNFVAVHRKVLSLEFGLENEQESWCSNRAWDPIWGKFRTSYWRWISNHCKNVDVWVDIYNWKLVLSSQCLIYNCFLATEHIWDQIWGKKLGEFLLWLNGLRTQHSLCENASAIPGLIPWVGSDIATRCSVGHRCS